MPPCLIAIDIDGTLLGSDGRVSARNRAALLAAAEAGLEIVIATGRRHSYAMRVLRELRLSPKSTVISSNGTVTRTVDASLINRTHMPVETARWLCRELEQFRETFVLTFDNVGADGEDRRGALVCENIDALHASIGAWMRSNEPYISVVDRMEHVLPPKRNSGTGIPSRAETGSMDEDLELANAPIQAMLCGTIEHMARAEAHLLRHPTVTGVGHPELPGCELVLNRTVYPERDLAILDILPAGCSKASAIADLAALRGCTMADVLAIGDNWNDLPMLQAAGSAILMGNAPEELLRMAATAGWVVGATNDQDGVAVALEAFIPVSR